jgi:hypothetical protein
MSLIDSIKENAIDKIEEAIDTEEERAEIKAKFNLAVDYVNEKYDLPGPDFVTAETIKGLISLGIDQLAKTLDDGEES